MSFEMFDAYRRMNTRNENGEYCDMDHLLRFWRANKGVYLSRLFGDKLILERPIEYTREDSELHRDMEDMIESYRNDSQTLEYALRDQMGITDVWRPHDQLNDVYHFLRNFLYNASYMIDNTINTEYIWYDYVNGDMSKIHRSYTVELQNGTHFTIQNGQKGTRLWGQIAKCLGLSDVWERLRIAHSQVLNQKKLKGTLCLSIEPLDYATASDNDNGWSSCMSWQEEGCYRMGTVEMMNSPMVICAYLRSDKQHMNIAGEEWNSKKWRAWIIVTKDVIICNRHYPYHQPTFAKEACNWVRELVGRAYGWDYDDVHTDFYDYMRETLGDNEIEFRTNYMYNDLGGDDVIGMLRESKRGLPGYINFSGPAECMVCGEEIYPDTQDADALECPRCHAEMICACCGEPMDEDHYYTDPDGNNICEACYSERCCECSSCCETIWADDATQVVFPIHQERGMKYLEKCSDRTWEHFSNWRGEIKLPILAGEDTCLCEDCVADLHLAKASVNRDATFSYGDAADYEDYRVPDPTKTDMETAFKYIEPRYWSEATHTYWANRNPTMAKEIRGFWEDQWEAFKEDFVSCQSD